MDKRIEHPLPPTPKPTVSMTPLDATEPVYYGPCSKCGESHGGWGSCNPETWQEGTARLLRALGLSDAANSKSCSQIMGEDILPAIKRLLADREALASGRVWCASTDGKWYFIPYSGKIEGPYMNADEALAALRVRRVGPPPGPPSPPPMPFRQFA